MNMLKGSIIFVVGAAIGVGGSYKFFEKKFGDIAESEIESMKMVIKNNRMKSAITNGADIDGDNIDGKYVCGEDGRVIAQVPEDEEQDDEQDQDQMEEAHRSYNEISAAYKTKVANSMNRESKERVNYNNMSREGLSNEKEPVDLSQQLPIVISSKSYVEDCEDYDKLTLHYYAIDGVVVDDNGEPFEDYEDFIGHDAIEQFGAFGVGDNLVYVRNDKVESDYEIIKLEESYS